MLKLTKVLAAVIIAGAVLIQSPTATPVGTELLLLADVSGSLDATDFALQRDGYAAAFRSQAVLDAIATNDGGIAVALAYWSTDQMVAVEWTHVFNAASAEAFAVSIETAGRPGSIGLSTGLANAMNFGSPLFTDNGFESERLVMDVSGDGPNQDGQQNCPTCQAARDNAVSLGVDQINALWINDRNYFGDDPEDAVQATLYGQQNVITGSGSFSMLVQDFSGFSTAVEEKIAREINPVPEPGSLSMLLLGFISFAGLAVRRKYRK